MAIDEIPAECKNNPKIRFFLTDKNHNPTEEAFLLLEKHYIRMPDKSWKHKTSQLLFRINGEPYRGEIQNYSSDDPKLLKHLEQGGHYGMMCLKGELRKIYGDKIPKDVSSITPQLILIDCKFLKHYLVPRNNAVIDGFIYKDSATMLYADAETFKSYIVLELAMCVANGIDFMGMKTHKCNVLLCNQENNILIMKDRAMRLYRGHQLRRQTFPLKILMNEGNLRSDDFIRRLFATIQLENIRLVIFDPIRRFGNWKENESDDINELFIRVIQPLTQAGVAVIFTHHTGKTGDFRGSSVFEDMIDAGYHVKRGGKKHSKTNDFTMYRTKGRTGLEVPSIYGKMNFDDITGPEPFTLVEKRLVFDKEINNQDLTEKSKMQEVADKILTLFHTPAEELKLSDIKEQLDNAKYDYGSSITLRRAKDYLLADKNPKLVKIKDKNGVFRRIDLPVQQELEADDENS